MRNTRKLAMILMALVLALVLPSAALAEAALEIPTIELPLVSEPTKLTLLMRQHSNIEDYETNSFTKLIYDETGVDIDFIFLPWSDWSSKLAIMFSTGENMGDVINCGQSRTSYDAYSKTGRIINLGPYYDEYCLNSKYLNEAYPEWDYYMWSTTTDNELYALASLSKNLPYGNRSWINQQWLDNLGLEMPTTLDELHDVLVAFRDQDANGNGDPNDELPFCGYGPTESPYFYYVQSFIFEQGGVSDHVLNVDGKISTNYMQPEWKECLEYVHQLVEEGLIPEISFTQDKNAFTAMVDADIVGAYFSSGIIGDVTLDVYKQWTQLYPVPNAEGEYFTGQGRAMPNPCWMVTADCADPVLAVRLGDWFLDPTEEMYLRSRFGIEGVNWERPKEGDKSIWGDDWEPKYSLISDPNKSLQNDTWRNIIPSFCWTVGLGQVWNGDPLAVRQMVFTNTEMTQYKMADGIYVPELKYTEEEYAYVSEIVATLNTYSSECRDRFIIGELNFEADYDNFLAEIKNIGYDECMELMQTAYERMGCPD